jgi:hypothetical protein
VASLAAKQLVERLESALDENHEPFTLRSRHAELHQRVLLLKKQLLVNKKAYKDTQQQLESLKQSHIIHATQLELVRHQSTQLDMHASDHVEWTVLHTPIKQHTVRNVWTCRKELMEQLHTLYPIAYDQDKRVYTIRGLHLPNAVYAGYDSDRIATALGHVVHLVVLMAQKLSVPLVYEMQMQGSRSCIRDVLSTMEESIYPLYAKGQQAFRFEYGVFLLNRNVEQLCRWYGVNVVDMRKTLYNLNALIDSITSEQD